MLPRFAKSEAALDAWETQSLKVYSAKNMQVSALKLIENFSFFVQENSSAGGNLKNSEIRLQTFFRSCKFSRTPACYAGSNFQFLHGRTLRHNPLGVLF